MNKKLISLAVAAAIAAPMAASATTTIYGRFDSMLNYIDGDSVDIDPRTGATGTPTETDSEWDVRTNTSRIGIKGSEDLGNGLKAIFQGEWAFNSTEGGSNLAGDTVLRNRLAYAGLSGNWGTAAIGRQWSPYYGAVDKTDIFNNSAYNAYYIGTFRLGNTISYLTPNWSGFSAGLALVIDNGDATTAGQNGIDAVNLALNYDNGPISIGFGYHKTEGWDTPPKPAAKTGEVDDFKGWGLAGSYTFGSTAKIIGQYESFDVPYDMSKSTADWKAWAIAGEYYWGNNTFRALYGNLDYDVDDDGQWALGWQYSFSKRTRFYIEYGEPVGLVRDLTASSLTATDSKIGTFGFRHDF